jgi:hypothetical protein
MATTENNDIRGPCVPADLTEIAKEFLPMSKQNKKMNNLEVNEQTIANSERIMKMLAQRGIISDKNIDGEKMKNVGQEKKYHNTLLLLKNYRTIAWVLECFPDTLAEELEQPFEGLDELLDRFDAEMGMENRKLENRMMSVQKSRLMIDRVNEALSVLKKKTDNGQKLYDLIYQTYISPEKLRLSDILYRLDMSPRHYYRLREQAVNILSIRLWS